MKERYLPAFPSTTAVHKFSHFLELYKQAELRDWLANDDAALSDFVQWGRHQQDPQGCRRP
jgi:hypothetical protein